MTESQANQPPWSTGAVFRTIVLRLLTALGVSFLSERANVIAAVGGLVLGTIVGGFLLCGVSGAWATLRSRAGDPAMELRGGMLTMWCVISVNLACLATVPLVANGINVREDRALQTAAVFPLPVVAIVSLILIIRRQLRTTLRHAAALTGMFAAAWVVIALLSAAAWLAVGGDFRF